MKSTIPPIPTATPILGAVCSLACLEIAPNIHTISRKLSDSLKCTQAEVELELFAGMLSSAVFGYMCQFDNSIEPNDTTTVVEKIKQTALQIMIEHTSTNK